MMRMTEKKGFIISVDRENKTKKFSFMTIALAIISTSLTKVMHYGQLSGIAAELKKIAKKNEKSSYVVDRRKA